MLNVKYFSYGSNLSLEQMKYRLEYMNNPINPGIPYNLQNYELVFNVGFNGFANITPRIGNQLEGLLYDLTPFQFDILDKFETLYYKHFFQINPATIGCVYIAKPECITLNVKPSLRYLNTIIEGCLNNRLIRTYNKLVTYKQQNFKLKKHKYKLI